MEKDFLSEEELRAAAKAVPEEPVEKIYEEMVEDMEKDCVEADTEPESDSKKVVAGERIGIKEGERIGLGIRNMQTQADMEKRKKKRRKRILITILILLLLICGAVTFHLKKQAEASADIVESSEDVVPGENQELVFGEVTSIQGNEITCDLVEEDASDSGTEKAVDGRSAVSGESPQGMHSENADMMPDMSGQDAGSKTFHSLGKAPVQLTIPVGTDVVTKLGTITTFARLASGDVVQMLMEKDGNDQVIIKIWIVG